MSDEEKEDGDAFSFISKLLVKKFVTAEEDIRRQEIADLLIKSHGSRKRPFKIVN